MYELNQIFIIGRLTKDPELSYTAKQMAICKCGIANHKDKDDAMFFNFIAFDKTAEFIADHFKKGLKVLIEGHLQQKKYQDETSGKTHIYIDILITKIYAMERYDKAEKENILEEMSKNEEEKENGRLPYKDD